MQAINLSTSITVLPGVGEFQAALAAWSQVAAITFNPKTSADSRPRTGVEETP
jgi:hypothetical protein